MEKPKCRLCGERHWGGCAFSDSAKRQGTPTEKLERKVMLHSEPRFTEQHKATPAGEGKYVLPAGGFDRKAYQREYMREYMRKWRSK